MKHGTLFLVMGICTIELTSINLPAQDKFLSRYDFRDVTLQSGTTDPTPVPVIPGLLFGSFHAVGFDPNPCIADRFGWRPNELGAVDNDNDFSHFTGELNEEKYLEVTLFPEASYVLHLDSISFSMRRSYEGIRSYAVRFSLDNFSTNLQAIVYSGNMIGVAPDNSFQWLYDTARLSSGMLCNAVIPGPSCEALSDPITFRFYGWNAETSQGMFCIDDVFFSGSTMLAPEPGMGTLLAIGLFMVSRLRAKRVSRVA